MSWHFLERWIEKANHHSTLIGKFWITFLIVCRMVIVASVGDRVYSDEQSEFKCNTLQPGCTNVCFNKFSPISHLRFWSFQILLVATPSVMFVIYSGHDQKNTKGGKTKKKKGKNSNPGRKQLPNKDGKSRGNNINNNSNNNNYNTNNNNSNSYDNSGKKSKSSPAKHSGDRSRGDGGGRDRTGRRKSPNGSPTQNIEADCSSPTPPAPHVMATLINYKNGGIHNPVEASIVDERKSRKESNLPWQEMRWNSLLHVAENGHKNNKNENITRNMWIKPRDSTSRARSREEESEKGDKKPTLNADIIMWGPPSSDDDNRNGKFRKANPSSLAEADMYQNRLEDGIIQTEIDKEQEIAMSAHPPPEYPGNDVDLVPKYPVKENSGFGFPEYEFVKTRTKKARFTRHFNLYLLSVFARLGLEVSFLVMQIMLFGFKVPALFKCEQWPCPNMVDCFISRPMEKTIFLYFMLIYTCICVLLNALELKYLIWVYLFGRPKLTKKVKRNGDQETGSILYDANGEPKYASRFLLDKDSELDEDELAELADEEEYDALMQSRFGVDNAFSRSAFLQSRDRDRRQLYRRGGHDKYQSKNMHERLAEMRAHELDLILNAEEMQDEYDMDIVQNDPVDEIIQMDMGDTGGCGPDDAGDDL